MRSRTGTGKPFGAEMRAEFMLDPACHYLNHGSYGALPRAVFDAANEVRALAEMQPGRFMQEYVMGAVRDSAERLGQFVGAQSKNLVFVANATAGINAVLRSMVLMPGDEVLTTSYVYNAVRKTLEFVTERANARLVIADMPHPVTSTADISERFVDAITGRTRLIVVDHVTSESALVMPLREIIEAARDRDIPVLVDGAHAPGMLRLSIEDLGATYYAGNCHKWLGAPRGSGFLWCDPDMQRRVRPPVISHFINEGFTRSFDWTGTRDHAAWLSIPAAIDFRAGLGEAEIYGYCRPLAARAASHLTQRWGTQRGEPRSAMSFMATVQIPDTVEATPDRAERLRRTLRNTHDTETFIKAINGKLWLRLSAYVYNEMSEYEALGELIPEVLAEI